MVGSREVLRNVEFRRLFWSRAISNVGNGVAPIALAFGVLALPGATPTSLSIVLAAQAIPLVLMLPFGGVIADRLGRARVIMVTDALVSVFVMTMAILFITGHANVPILAILGALSGLNRHKQRLIMSFGNHTYTAYKKRGTYHLYQFLILVYNMVVAGFGGRENIKQFQM
jgi:MFS family permease